MKDKLKGKRNSPQKKRKKKLVIYVDIHKILNV